MWRQWDPISWRTLGEARFGRVVEWSPPVQDPPGDVVGGPPALDCPDVGAQDGLGLVPFVLE